MTNRRGNVAMIFALSLAPILMLIGLAVDYSRSRSEMTALQHALDSAALAAAKLPKGTSDEEIQRVANAYIDANYNGPAEPRVTKPTRTEDSITLNAEVEMDTLMLSAVGIKTQKVNVSSQATRGGKKVEVAMVLDNSGSMAGAHKIGTLKTSAKGLIDALEATAADPEAVKIGLVPFTIAVNVGPENADAEWIDHDARSPQHAELFDKYFTKRGLTRFDLFEALGYEWAGCVETREYPLDVNDDFDIARDDHIFQPYFAPDSPDDADIEFLADNGINLAYQNDYLQDESGENNAGGVGACIESGKGGRKNECRDDEEEEGGDDEDDEDEDDGDDDDENGDPHSCGGKHAGHTHCMSPEEKAADQLVQRQEKTTKYLDPDRSGKWGEGPNFGCYTGPLQPLTNDFELVRARVDAMNARGNTNIHEGVAWGWRVLSPTVPFTEGSAYDTDDTEKFLVVLTDGANNVPGAANHNGSVYSPYGFVFSADSRIGLGVVLDDLFKWDLNDLLGYLSRPWQRTRDIRDILDDRTAKTCENAKEAGITIYTIAFAVNDRKIKNMMKACASSDDHYFDSGSSEDLEETFETITKDISSLRISR